MGGKLVYGKEEKSVDPDLLSNLYNNVKVDQSQQQMALCLASLSEMAHSGNDTAIARETSSSVSPATLAKQAKSKLRTKLEKKLQRKERNTKDDVMKQLQLLDSLDHPEEDDNDWLEMRVWLVKCLQTNLQEFDADIPAIDRSENPRTRLRRQKALEGRNLLTVNSLDSSGNGSSFESAAS